MEITVEIKLTSILSGGELHLQTLNINPLTYQSNEELKTAYKQAKLEATKHNFNLDEDCGDEVFANLEIKSDLQQKSNLEYSINDFLDSL